MTERRAVAVLNLLTLLVSLVALGPAWAQDAPNLLRNISFEEPGNAELPTGWVAHCTGGSQALRDATAAHTGHGSGHLIKVVDGKSHVAALVFPRIDVTGGGTYTLSGWGKGHVPAGGAVLFLYQYDKDGKWLGNYFHGGVPADTDEWVPLHTTEKVRPDCAWVQVRFEIYGDQSRGEAWVDDVYFGQDVAAPGPVRSLEARPEARSVRLTWAAPEGEKAFGYQVFRAPYPRFSPAQNAFTGFTQQTHFGEPMPKGFSYYAVVAVDEALNQSVPVLAGPIHPPQASNLPELVAWIASPAKRWGPDLPFPLPVPEAGNRSVPAGIELARGEWASLQVLVGAPKVQLKDVSVGIGELRGPKGVRLARNEVQVLIQEYVELQGQARWVPDPLPPARAVDLEPGMLRGWWVLIHTPDELPAGEYRGNITVAATGQKLATLRLRVNVWPFTVPRGNHYGGSFGVWGQQMAEQEQVKVGSEEYNRLYRRYLDFLLEHRMIPRALPGDLRSEETARWLDDERVASFPISTPAGWARIMNEEQVARFKEECDFLRGKGWLRKGYVYNFDEPEEKDYAFAVEMAKRIREAGKDIPILLTEQPEEGLHGAVDIWCPLLNLYAATEQRCRERQQKGEHVWWYVCLAPGAPWPNYMLTNDPVDARVLSWLQVKHGVEGELYWAATCFPGDAWAQGLNPQWPGDGYLCYPGKPRGLDGPVTCIRAEAIRDAKEDIELIWLLRKLATEKGQQAQAEQVLRQAVDRVVTDFTHYTKSDADFVAARKMIFEEIRRLKQVD